MEKPTALQLTLGEMHILVTSPRAWGAAIVIVLVLGISGPFQTFEYLTLGPRLAYWAIMGIASWATGSFFGTWAGIASAKWPMHSVARFLLAGLSAGVPVTLTVIIINYLALPGVFRVPGEILILGSYCIGISFAIVGLLKLFKKDQATDTQVQPAQILRRLPMEKRGKLISLSVEDHYVEVVTTKGKHLVLMRLGDAIGETRGVEGLQIHRSHWVALDGVLQVQRTGQKFIIKTKAGAELPISRTFASGVKQAGLLA